MSAPIWLTNAGDLGVIPEEEYYEFFFDAYNPGGGSVQFSLISGSLPSGIELTEEGTMLGIPTGRAAGVPAAVSKVTTSTFTIRITNNQDLVADRTFSITVAGILPQIIIPAASDLGSYLDGTYLYIDINTIEPNSYLESTFTILSGSLPQGVSLNSTTGIISGYIIPFVFPAQSAQAYQFTIKADNGINLETKTYTLTILAICTITADNSTTVIGPSEFKADAIGEVTADILGPSHNPVILTIEGSLGNVFQNSQVEIQIDALDFEDDDLSFELVSGYLPIGLSLNTNTGWIVGYLPYGTLGTSTYTFSVKCFKTSNPVYYSATKAFSIRILGQITDILTWDTESDLGTIYTGDISELSISASTPSGRNLQYQLYDSFGTLPYGLSLTIDGLITGRVSFETFILDGNTTLLDDNSTSFDRTYNFTVLATDVNNYVFETKQFTLRVKDLDQKPYENLYITAMPTRAQRNIFNNIINNTDIFPESVLYRLSDPWFGKNSSRRSLFLAGLNPQQASEYISAMTFNHYWKNLTFGALKTAQALDDNFNIKYEVVYLELIDNKVNAQGLGPNLSVTLNPNSTGITTIYPNSFPNMQKRLEDNIGYENRRTLPGWMTSRQPDGTVIGFTRAFVLCYTQPGKSIEVAQRLQLYQQENNIIGIPISFTIDRYLWDNSLSNVFNKTANAYVSNNFVSGSGLISANTNSNLVLGLSTNITGTGTIYASPSSTTITGNNTTFYTQLTIGFPIYIGNVILGNISSIRSATELTLDRLPYGIISNSSYVSTTNVTIFAQELHVNDTLLVNNVIIGTVKTITSNTNITLYTNSISNVNSASFTYTVRDTVSQPGVGDKYLKYPQVGVIS